MTKSCRLKFNFLRTINFEHLINKIKTNLTFEQLQENTNSIEMPKVDFEKLKIKTLPVVPVGKCGASLFLSFHIFTFVGRY